MKEKRGTFSGLELQICINKNFKMLCGRAIL